MKKAIYIFITNLILVPAPLAQVELKHYGFLKGDKVYTTESVVSYGAENLSAAQPAIGIDNP